MPLKTITKICVFVIGSAVAVWGCVSCSVSWPGVQGPAIEASSGSDFLEPEVVGTIDSKEIKESSGLAASKCSNDVLWTHNDSGNGPLIFAVGSDGKVLGSWKLEGAESVDWEDIAESRSSSGRCQLFVGDIGDNELKRRYISVYRVDEPEAIDSASNAAGSGGTVRASEIRLLYPDGPHNAETLLVHPETEDIYVLTKSKDSPAGIYRVRSDVWKAEIGKTAVRMQKVGDLSVPAFPVGFVTGGDISADGRRVVICDYFNAYEYTLPKGEGDFNEIWKQTPTIIDVGRREQGEAVAYSPTAGAIFLTSESKSGKSPLIEVRRK
jgi:hypothetical protein